jgi:sigma-B regulation protein RsbU (phosphoserine phosphatase)
MPLAENRLALAIGDASGKGLAAALMIASVQSSLRTAALFTSDDLARLLKTVNLQAYNSSLNDRFATVFYGVFDRTRRMLRYVNAGHNPPFVLRRDGAVEWLEPSGAPVGMFADSNYRESILHLNPGDVVITYTDGVVEVTNSAGVEWGVEGLMKAAAAWEPQCVQGAEDLVRQIFRAMDDFSGGCQTDDAAVAVLRVV